MRKIAFLFLLPLLLILACAPGRNLEKKLAPNTDITPWFKGVMVYDPNSEKILFEHNSDHYFTPASTTKLLTFYTGLEILGDSIPAINYEVLNDTLYFSGTGDPTFLHRDFESSAVVNFLKTHNNLVLITTENPEKPLGPGWAWDDYNYSFSAERSEFPIYGNTTSFSSLSGDSLMVKPVHFLSGVVKDSTAHLPLIHRDRNKNSFKIAPFGTSEIKKQVPFITSAQLTATLLRDTVEQKVNLKYGLPRGVTLKNKLYSQPTDSIYKRILQDSDNFLAEQLLLIAAGEISDTLQAQIAIDHMLDNFLQDMPDRLQWVDGSGLSRYNLMTPRSLVYVLHKIYNEVPQKRIFSLLPAGGISGTIKNDYKPSMGADPYVFAKTGTLKNNHSLAGYLKTKSNKVLIFSYMNSNYIVPTAVVKAQMEEFLHYLYLNY